jgi:hypothetical protein
MTTATTTSLEATTITATDHNWTTTDHDYREATTARLHDDDSSGVASGDGRRRRAVMFL